ncbi:hypothetical protein GGR56DRAFT_113972 [Xylariaceae sp. FL0804]|nr:hypothetical protein GGR56DRAFT_113972 [Xylariaceae sp. FL0804]
MRLFWDRSTMGPMMVQSSQTNSWARTVQKTPLAITAWVFLRHRRRGSWLKRSDTEWRFGLAVQKRLSTVSISLRLPVNRLDGPGWPKDCPMARGDDGFRLRPSSLTLFLCCFSLSVRRPWPWRRRLGRGDKPCQVSVQIRGEIHNGDVCHSVGLSPTQRAPTNPGLPGSMDMGFDHKGASSRVDRRRAGGLFGSAASESRVTV